MITGERRGRRGMTVLGKIPAVPKPINLPSQRLENRGLDPNVEIVPRGTVTWGNTARSPPTAGSNWGGGSQPSSPPVSAGAWGQKPAPAWGPNSARPSSAGSNRPQSAGSTQSSSAARPSSAGGRHPQDLPRPSSAGNQDLPPHPQNAWGPPANTRPSSASGLQNTQAAVARPRSAESRPNGRVSLLTSDLSHTGPPAPWGPAASRKPPEELPQPSRFTLTTGDFPTLGSEKNPNLRPQQRDRPDHADDRTEERPPPAQHNDSYPYDDAYPPGRFNDADAPIGWGRGPFRGPPGMEGGYPMPGNSWRREPPHDLPDGEEHWAPSGPYVPGGPPRFPNPEFRFGPPGSYGRGGADGYGPPPFMRPMNPERPGPQFGPGMFPGPYEGYYGYPPGYNMDDREMMMWGGPGYGGFHPDFSRHPMGPRPRPMPNHAGFGKDAEGFHPDYRPPGKMKEGDNVGPRPDGHPDFRRDPPNKIAVNEPKRPMHPRPHGQRDWGNDEPMDFSRPVFEKESGTPPAKNHKVSFKAEPTVADVAILKKPQQQIKSKQEDGDSGDIMQVEERNEEMSKLEAAPIVSSEAVHKDIPSSAVEKEVEKEPQEEKNVPDAAAGVLGRAPASVAENEKQGSPRASNASKSSAGDHGTSQHPKESFKVKPKAVVHELEKEWRPKLRTTELKVDVGKASRSELPSASPDYEAENYDYEAQRAKMKEIAAQRARQLQKEEEERIKEQKAKALAKLEELNRRSTVSTDVPASDEVNDVAQKDGDQKAEVQFGTFQSSDITQEAEQSPGKIEHGKRNGDRKGNRNKEERTKVQQQKKELNVPNATENGHRRKKSGRNGKNRQKNEGDSSGGISSQSEKAVAAPDPTPEVTAVDVAREKPSVPEPVPQQVVQEEEEATTVEAIDASVTEERGSAKVSKRFQRRFQASKRSSKPQDVRISDKSHAAEGMVWAPVRTPAGPRSEVSPDSNGEKHESSSPHQPRYRRAELERYTPSRGERERDKRQHSSRGERDWEKHHHNQQQAHQQNQNQQHQNQQQQIQNQGGSHRQQHSSRGDRDRDRDWDKHHHSGPQNQQQGHNQQETRAHHSQQQETRSSQDSRSHHNQQQESRPHHNQQQESRLNHNQQQESRLNHNQQQESRLHHNQQQESRPHHNESRPNQNHQEGRPHHSQQEGRPHHSQQQQQGPPSNTQQSHYNNHPRSHPRRGRFGGRGGIRTVVDIGAKVEKQRMVIDATGGAVPNQVAG